MFSMFVCCPLRSSSCWKVEFDFIYIIRNTDWGTQINLSLLFLDANNANEKYICWCIMGPVFLLSSGCFPPYAKILFSYSSVCYWINTVHFPSLAWQHLNKQHLCLFLNTTYASAWRGFHLDAETANAAVVFRLLVLKLSGCANASYTVLYTWILIAVIFFLPLLLNCNFCYR